MYASEHITRQGTITAHYQIVTNTCRVNASLYKLFSVINEGWVGGWVEPKQNTIK